MKKIIALSSLALLISSSANAAALVTCGCDPVEIYSKPIIISPVKVTLYSKPIIISPAVVNGWFGVPQL